MLRGSLSAASAWLDRLLVERYPAEPAALFRIGGAVAVLADLFATRALADLFWGTGPGRSVIDLGYALWAAVLVLLLIGWKTRWMAIFSYALTFPLILNLNQIFEYHIDYFLRTWGFFLLFLDSGKVWSVDAWLARRKGGAESSAGDRTVAKWVVVLFLFQLSLDYFDSGVRKLLDEELWQKGFGLYWPLVVRYGSSGFGRGLVNTGWLIWAMSHLVMLWELAFPALVAWKRTRALAILAGVGLHIGIVALLPISYFGEMMVTLYLLFLPWDRIRGWFSRSAMPPATVAAPAGPVPRQPLKRALVLTLVVFLLVAKLGHFDLTPWRFDRWTTIAARNLSSFVEHPVFMSFHFKHTGVLEVEVIHPDGRRELEPLLVTADGYPGTLSRASTRAWVYMLRVGFQNPRLSRYLVRWLDETRPELCGARLYQRWVVPPPTVQGDVDVWTNAERTVLADVTFDRDPDLCGNGDTIRNTTRNER